MVKRKANCRLVLSLITCLFLISLILLAACAGQTPTATATPTLPTTPSASTGTVETKEINTPVTLPTPEAGPKLSICSVAFQDGQKIPAKYTGSGQDISPPLTWNEPPAGTQSFALIVDDPDAPGRVFTHWILFNVPSGNRELAEAIPAQAQLPGGALQGKNDFGKIGYGGPYPPLGTSHRYRFIIHALDKLLNLTAGVSRQQVLDSMQGHILAEAQLTGTYQR